MRKWLPWLLMVTLISLSAGCAKPAPESSQTAKADGPAPAPAVTTVRLLDIGKDVLMDSIVSAYLEAHPNVRVDQMYLPYQEPDEITYMQDKIDKGEVDIVPVVGMDTMIRQKLVLALDPYIKAGQFDLKPYGPGLDQMRYDGALYQMPFSLSAMFIVYNRDMFRAAGVPEPTAGWTWEQFRDTAGRLTHGADAGKVWGFGPFHPWQMMTFYAGQQGNMSHFPQPAEVREMLRFFGTMAFQDHTMPVYQPTGPGSGSDDRDRLFLDGNAAMAIQSLDFFRFGTGAKFQVGVAPYPTLPGIKPSLDVSAVSFGIAATSRNPEAAWDLLAYMTGAEGAMLTVKNGLLPGYGSDAIKRAWFDRQPAPDPRTAFLFDSPWSVTSVRIDDTWLKLTRLLRTAVDQTLSGQRTYEQAAADYATGYEQILAQK